MLFENENNYFDFLTLYNYKDNFNSLDNKFSRGNMFDNEYVPYKNYNYKNFKITNNVDELLLKIMKYSFAINDLNLYLDLHENDAKMYEEYKCYVNKLKELEMEYEKANGSITNCNVNNKNYTWINSPWPWDSEVTKYV